MTAARALADGDGEQPKTQAPREGDPEVIVLEEAPPGDEASEQEKADYWERVRQQYEAAKERSRELVEKTRDAAGDYYDKAKDATGDAYDRARETTSEWYEGARDWTQEDIGKAGDWHYRVLVISKEDIREDPAKVEAMLNELGAERFECFWVEPLDSRQTRLAFFFKKSGFSYLKSIPAKEFWRFLPSGDGGDNTQ